MKRHFLGDENRRQADGQSNRLASTLGTALGMKRGDPDMTTPSNVLLHPKVREERVLCEAKLRELEALQERLQRYQDDLKQIDGLLQDTLILAVDLER